MPACDVLTEARLDEVAARLVALEGVHGVSLGGSRARGDHQDGSDWDLGLYYENPLDVDGLAALARELAGPDARVTAVGEWGPWVDGGAWLRIDGAEVDWLYRDLGRVRDAWTDAQQGRFTFHAQVGHPLGVPDFAYAGEIALARVLADPTGQLSALQRECSSYPPKLSQALVEGLWEAEFLLPVAAKGAERGDTAYVAGCLFRVVLLCAHALHGRAQRWLINEKGAVESAGTLHTAPASFATNAQAVLAGLGEGPESLTAAIAAAKDLVAATSEACARTSTWVPR
jgi:predicted nucleotidyltransferase